MLLRVTIEASDRDVSFESLRRHRRWSMKAGLEVEVEVQDLVCGRIS